MAGLCLKRSCPEPVTLLRLPPPPAPPASSPSSYIVDTMADEYDPSDAGLAYVRGMIRSHENFPIEGVLFQDGASLRLGNPSSPLSFPLCACRPLPALLSTASAFTALLWTDRSRTRKEPLLFIPLPAIAFTFPSLILRHLPSCCAHPLRLWHCVALSLSLSLSLSSSLSFSLAHTALAVFTDNVSSPVPPFFFLLPNAPWRRLRLLLSPSLKPTPLHRPPDATVFPVFSDPRAVDIVVGRMYEAISKKHVAIDAIVGLDARGFLFGPMLAQRLNCAFVPVRKVGKVRIAAGKEGGTQAGALRHGLGLTGGQGDETAPRALGGAQRACAWLRRKAGRRKTRSWELGAAVAPVAPTP